MSIYVANMRHVLKKSPTLYQVFSKALKALAI
jgi:hypothetical protein